MEIIRQSRGKAKDYAPLLLDLYENKNGNVKPVKNALENLAKDVAYLKSQKDQREILIGFRSDPYPNNEIELNLTEGAIKTLIENNLRFSILTEKAENALQHFDLLKECEKARYGTKLLSNANGKRLNPEEPPLLFGIESLKEANKQGIKTWVDLDPVIDPDQALDLIKKLHPYINHWKIGKLNNGESDIDWSKFREDVTALLESKGASYSLKKSLTDIKETKKKNPPKFVSITGNGNSEKAEDTDPWTEGDIPTRKGNRNILVIAPHGHPGDDKGTYQLARRMADELDCYAVVNKKYRKPGKVKSSQKYEKKYLVDLNLSPEIDKSKNALKDFFGPIEKFKEEIIKKYGSLFILHVHGIGSANLKKVAALLPEFKVNSKHLHILVGYGQRKDDNTRLTADLNNFVGPICEKFREQGLNAAIAPTGAIQDKNGEDQWYCGNHPDRLNQTLCNPKHKVQSLQLEFKYGGLRNNADNINKAAINFSNTVRTVWEKQTSEENLSLPVVVASTPDLNEIYTNLMAIVSKGFENTMLEAGRYLIDTFYGGDPRVAHADKKKQSLSSLNQYILKLREKNPDAPKKSWIYNAVNLVIEHEAIKAHSDELFHTYGKLPLSHKVLLFPVKDMGSKKHLIEYADEHRPTPTVVEFKNIRNNLTKSKSTNNRKTESNQSLLKIIASPEKLFTDEMSKFLTPEALKQLPSSKLEKLRAEANESIVRINANIQLETNHIKRYQELIEAINNTSQQDSEEHSTAQNPQKKVGVQNN